MAVLSRYLKIYPSAQKPDHLVVFSTMRTSTAVIPAAMLEAARAGSLTGPEAETLTRLGVLVKDPALEREQALTLLKRVNGNTKCFSATVVLNLDCNLDCGYCYEGEFRNEQYMSRDTAQLLVDTLVRDHVSQGRDLSLTFYGGEPLLSEDLIRMISLQLQDASRRNNTRYWFNLVTNGTLLNRDMAERLVPLGLRCAKITLDGPREIHDRQRPYTSGSGSFDVITDNVAAICDLVRIQIGGNFYENNYREFPRLLDHLMDRGVTPEKVWRVEFSPVTTQAGCTDQTSGCASCNEPWLMEAIPQLREEIMKRGFPATKPGLLACMIELENVVVVKHDGSIYKCPAFMGWEGLSVGNLADGVSDYQKSHCVGNWQKDECLECAYLPLCFGGCRFVNILQGKAMGDLDCRREFLDATLETLIRQNMTYPAALAAPLPPKSP